MALHRGRGRHGRGTRVTRRERNGREAGLKIDELRRVCVIGAGLMGRQIALNAAHRGFAVRLWDASAEQLRAAERWTDEYIAGRIEKGRWTKEEAATARAHLSFAANLAEAASDADLAIEAGAGDLGGKRKGFRGPYRAGPPRPHLRAN